MSAEVAMALRTLRTCRHPRRALTVRQAATIIGVTPRCLELIEAGRAPLWPEIARAALDAYCATERDRALVTLTAALIASRARWMAEWAAGPVEGA